MSNVFPLIPVTATEPEGLVISCDDCAFQHSDRCAECVVSFICDLDEDESVVLDAAEHRALRLLTDAGLAPELHLTARSAS